MLAERYLQALRAGFTGWKPPRPLTFVRQELRGLIRGMRVELELVAVSEDLDAG